MLLVVFVFVVVLDWQRRHDGLGDDNFRLIIMDDDNDNDNDDVDVDVDAVVVADAITLILSLQIQRRSTIKADIPIVLIPQPHDDDDDDDDDDNGCTFTLDANVIVKLAIVNLTAAPFLLTFTIMLKSNNESIL